LFFQAEDGIRDRTVTGVQTCALPIFKVNARTVTQGIYACDGAIGEVENRGAIETQGVLSRDGSAGLVEDRGARETERIDLRDGQIGRASGRERVEGVVCGLGLEEIGK